MSSLPEAITNIRDLDIFSLLVIAAQLEDEGFNVGLDSFLGDFLNRFRHPTGNQVGIKTVPAPVLPLQSYR